IEKGINLIVTHHPIWFMPRKKLNGEDYVSRIIIQAIKNDIALYACHTNLDNVQSGVNEMIGRKLGVEKMRILSPKKNLLVKLVAYVGTEGLEEMAAAVKTAGCRDLQVQIGEGEARLEMVLPAYAKGNVLGAIRSLQPGGPTTQHSVVVQDKLNVVGSGMIGNLPEAMGKMEFLAHVKAKFGCGGIRFADAPLKKIKKIAWCGGAGSFLTKAAMRAGASAFVTGDITYHKFFDSEDKMLLLDIGHFESEQFTSELIYTHLSKTFSNFAIRLSEIRTNPVKYY
ncbi:MAG TPA: Nif3-like dinuclear metal center hexameric protein, partial [Bacteroidetes bacterium]|nr:Nif3-like dinuclear metal center hexameric protein [Bacteroidota bacterium]